MSVASTCVRAAGALAAAAIMYSAPAEACSFAAPDRNDVPIAKWVSSVDQIVLARVVAAKERKDSVLEDDAERGVSPTGGYEFTLETIEAIKGKPPARFVLNGMLSSSADQDALVAANKHTNTGRFWLYFAPEEGGSNAACQWSPQLAFDHEYLIFRNKNGELERWFGRAVQNIPTRDDAWLLAVKRLAADPTRKHGRSATIPQILASATFVLEGVVEKCWAAPPAPTPPGPEPKSLSELTGHRIVRQLWGKTMEHNARLDALVWPETSDCKVGERRLVAFFREGPYDAEFFRLRVVGGKVDFGGIVNGTDQGLVDTDSRYGLWYAQVDLPPKLVWSVDELAAALTRRAAGMDEDN